MTSVKHLCSRKCYKRTFNFLCCKISSKGSQGLLRGKTVASQPRSPAVGAAQPGLGPGARPSPQQQPHSLGCAELAHNSDTTWQQQEQQGLWLPWFSTLSPLIFGSRTGGCLQFLVMKAGEDSSELIAM